MSKRPRKPRFEGETTIVIQGRRTGDAIIAITTLVLLAVFIAGGADAIRNARTQWGTLLIAIGGWAFFGWTFIGAAWRVWVRRPAFVADETGLQLHPSLAPQPLRWGDVQSIAIKPGRTPREPDVIRIRLERQVQSLAHPLGSRRLRLALPYLDLSRREATDLLRQLRRLRGLKVSSPRDWRQVS